MNADKRGLRFMKKWEILLVGEKISKAERKNPGFLPEQE
jgi:hypothetical protein